MGRMDRWIRDEGLERYGDREMEGWKNGGMGREGNGKMEELKDGRMEEWEDGGMRS